MNFDFNFKSNKHRLNKTQIDRNQRKHKDAKKLLPLTCSGMLVLVAIIELLQILTLLDLRISLGEEEFVRTERF